MRRKKDRFSFIDNERYFSRWEKRKEGDIVSYKRLSDEQTSIGTIRWFEIDKSKRVIVTLIDSLLDNYQSCYFEDIDDNIDSKANKKLKKKIKSNHR